MTVHVHVHCVGVTVHTYTSQHRDRTSKGIECLDAAKVIIGMYVVNNPYREPLDCKESDHSSSTINIRVRTLNQT